jgi:membrane protein DedA with SNARE-associated domain
MTLSTLIAQYGLAAVFAGTLFEGETVLLLAGYAAHRGYLDFSAVVAVAVAGAVAGDQFWFWLGRRHGARLLARRPSLADAAARALRQVERHPRASILAMRFLWGLRTALPLALGMSRVRTVHFLTLNGVSALLWAPLVAALGYAFGAALATHPQLLERYELAGMALVAALALLARVLHRRAQRKLNAR